MYAMVEAYHGQDKIRNFIQGIEDGRVAAALGPYGWGEPPILYGDNQGALDLAETNVFARKLGHIDLRCAIVNQKVDSGLVINEKVASAENVADINTKPLRGAAYDRLVRRVAQD